MLDKWRSMAFNSTILPLLHKWLSLLTEQHLGSERYQAQSVSHSLKLFNGHFIARPPFKEDYTTERKREK